MGGRPQLVKGMLCSPCWSVPGNPPGISAKQLLCWLSLSYWILPIPLLVRHPQVIPERLEINLRMYANRLCSPFSYFKLVGAWLSPDPDVNEAPMSRSSLEGRTVNSSTHYLRYNWSSDGAIPVLPKLASRHRLPQRVQLVGWNLVTSFESQKRSLVARSILVRKQSTGRTRRPSHHAKFKPRWREKSELKTGLKSLRNRRWKREKDDETLLSLSADLKGALSVPPYAPRH